MIKSDNIYKFKWIECEIGDEGAGKISEMLMKNTSLTDLSIECGNKVLWKNSEVLFDARGVNS